MRVFNIILLAHTKLKPVIKKGSGLGCVVTILF